MPTVFLVLSAAAVVLRMLTAQRARLHEPPAAFRRPFDSGRRRAAPLHETSGTGKLLGAKQLVEGLNRLGVGAQLRQTIGVLEILGAAGLIVGLWLEALGVAAAAGLALLMAGAIVYHVRANERGKELAPPAALLAVSVVTAVLRITTA